MDIIITEPSNNTIIKKIENDIERISAGILRTIWDFSEQRPSAVYALIDFSREKVGSLVRIDSRIVKAEELKDLPAPYNFKKELERIESLESYLTNDLKELKSCFRQQKLLVPSRIYAAVNIREEKTRTSLEYIGVTGRNLLEIDESLDKWSDTIKKIHFSHIYLPTDYVPSQ